MNIDLHNNNDDLYRKAYERLEEEPSAEVWDKVLAKLDSRDAQHFQQKSIRWKRISLLLLLLLGTVLLTGGLYIATKKAATGFSAVKENDKYGGANNKAPVQPRSNDSNIFSYNSNQPPNHATEPNRTSGTNAVASAQPATPEQPADEVSPQVDARTGKQDFKPLQDSSVAGKDATAQQVLSQRKKDNANPAIMLHPAIIPKETTTVNNYETADNPTSTTVKKKSSKVPVPNEETAAGQNKAAAQQHSTVASTFKTKPFSGGKNPENSVDAVPVERNGLLPFSLLNLNEFPADSILRKEATDSTIVAKAGAMAASLKKENTTVAAAGSNKKTVKIAPLHQHRLQLTGYASLDAAEYHLDDDDDHENNNQQPPSHREDRHKIGDREKHGLSFSVGITGRYQITNKLSLKSGLNYSSITINSKAQTLYVVQNGSQGIGYKFVSSSGYAFIKSSSGSTLAVGDSARTGTAQQQLQFLSVPVMAGYTVYSSRRFSIIPSLGAAANFLTGTRVRMEISEPASAKETVTLTRLNGLQSWYPSLLADAEVQYHFKKNVSLTFLPSFRYAVNPLTRNNAVKTSPYSFGLGMGFTYHF